MTLSWWCYLTILSSAPPFSCPQSFLATESFPVSQLFTSGGQNFGASASAPVLPVNIQGWFPWRLTGLISLLSKGLSEVFSSTTIRKHQFCGILPSLWSSSHNRTWSLGQVILPEKQVQYTADEYNACIVFLHVSFLDYSSRILAFQPLFSSSHIS